MEFFSFHSLPQGMTNYMCRFIGPAMPSAELLAAAAALTEAATAMRYISEILIYLLLNAERHQTLTIYFSTIFLHGF